MENKEDKLKFYTERYEYWTDMSLSQLSLTNNLLLTISIGFIAFCFDKDNIDQSENRFFLTSIILMGISVFLGLCVVFSRLYDFRISRSLLLIRKRIYVHNQKTMPDNFIGHFNMYDRLGAFLFIIFRKLPSISKDMIDDYENNKKSIEEKFTKLRILSKKLGSASWRWSKIQALFLLLAIVFYIISFL